MELTGAYTLLHQITGIRFQIEKQRFIALFKVCDTLGEGICSVLKSLDAGGEFLDLMDEFIGGALAIGWTDAAAQTELLAYGMTEQADDLRASDLDGSHDAPRLCAGEAGVY
jgi:hypothetical protein